MSTASSAEVSRQDEPVAVVRTPVHPLALRLAGLLSPMSQRDQKLCFQWCQRILYATGIVLYPAAWYCGTFKIFAFGVIAAAGLCCVLFLPNWLQRPDPQLTYVDKSVTKSYYEALASANAAASASSPATK